MGSVRVERVQEKVKFEVARILQSEMNDPRMGFVTVVGCELSKDYRHCKLYVSILSEKEAEERKVMRALSDATGYIQRLVAGGLRTRVTPQLEFFQDKGAEQSVKISSLLDGIRREREAREAAQASADEADADEADADEADADADGEPGGEPGAPEAEPAPEAG